LEGQDVLVGDELHQSIDEMVRLAQENDSALIVKMMDELIPGSAVQISSTPDITAID
jgi:hypothetical protein